MLGLEKVSYSTPPPRIVNIFEDVAIKITQNENTMIFGDNGSGKTTLVKLLMKFIPPCSGIVEGGPRQAICVFENFDDQLFFSTVFEELASTGNIEEKEYEQTISLLGVREILKKSTLQLSYTQKARLVFALAYLSNREFLILDCLPRDERIDKMISEIVRKKKRTMLVLLPEKDSREIEGRWDRYLIKDKKLIKL